MEERSESGFQETAREGAAQDGGLAQITGKFHVMKPKEISAAKRRHMKARHGSAGEQSTTSPSPARDGTDRSFPNSQQSPHVNQLPEMV